MELNREQIVKALGQCSGELGGLCSGCPLRSDTYCTEHLAASALSLIRELTEENEAQAETITNLIDTIKGLPIKTVESKVAIFPKFKCKTELIDAYTVRDIQTKFAMHFGTYTNDDTVKVSEVFALLSKFAEEMLEEE